MTVADNNLSREVSMVSEKVFSNLVDYVVQAAETLEIKTVSAVGRGAIQARFSFLSLPPPRGNGKVKLGAVTLGSRYASTNIPPHWGVSPRVFVLFNLRVREFCQSDSHLAKREDEVFAEAMLKLKERGHQDLLKEKLEKLEKEIRRVHGSSSPAKMAVKNRQHKATEAFRAWAREAFEAGVEVKLLKTILKEELIRVIHSS